MALYGHQAEAVQALRKGQNVIVSTGIASGKSLCYHVPVLEALIGDPRSRALYLFPTKALTQDQVRTLNALAGDIVPVRSAIFDGDTPSAERASIKRGAQIVFTNPDLVSPLRVYPAVSRLQ